MAAMRFCSQMLLWFAGIYIFAIAASVLYQPSADRRAIDTLEFTDTIFSTETKYLMFSLKRLDHLGPRVIVLGASNAQFGLRPGMLEPHLGIPVSNLSIGGSNVHEVNQILDMTLEKIPANSWKQTVFVFGAWYGQFVNDRRRWPDGKTDIDVEAGRYHLYESRGHGGRIEPVLPQVAMSVAELAMRPLLIGSKLYSGLDPLIAHARRLILRALGNDVPDLEEADTLVLTPEEQKAEIQDVAARMGNVRDWGWDGFDGLTAMARDISNHGARLIVLDLPLPSWHKNQAVFEAEYLRRLAVLKPRLCAIPNVSVETLDGFSDKDFFDYVHPRPRVEEQWARKTADLVMHHQGCSQ